MFELDRVIKHWRHILMAGINGVSLLLSRFISVSVALMKTEHIYGAETTYSATNYILVHQDKSSPSLGDRPLGHAPPLEQVSFELSLCS